MYLIFNGILIGFWGIKNEANCLSTLPFTCFHAMQNPEIICMNIENAVGCVTIVVF